MKEIHLRYPGNFGAPGVSRSEKRKRTSDEIAKQNESNRIRKLQRLILANFVPGESYHLTLNYRVGDRPETAEHAKKMLAKFLSRMRQDLKAAGQTFRWIAVTEYGKKGQALHHHLIVEDIDGIQKMVKKNWKWGGTFWSDTYEDGEMEQLAAYMVKKETKEKAGEPIKGCRYTHSRGNLKMPEPEREVMRRRRWPDEPKVPKGWELIKGSLYDGVNPATGYPYREYRIRRMKGGDKYARDYLYRDKHKRAG